MSTETWNCPFCGTELRLKAKVCTACGSDSKTGWSEVQHSNDPALHSDYDESVEREFGKSAAIEDQWKIFLITALIVVTLMGAIIGAMKLYA